MFSVFVPTDCQLKKVPVTDLAAVPDQAVWIDLFNPTREEIAYIERTAGLRIPGRDKLVDTSSPMIANPTAGSGTMRYSTLSCGRKLTLSASRVSNFQPLFPPGRIAQPLLGAPAAKALIASVTSKVT